MRKITVLLACLLAMPTLQAMSWQELQTEIDSVESGEPPNREIILRVSEIVQTLLSYNQATQTTYPGSQLFCPQPGGSLQLDEVVSMMRALARTEPVTDATLVQTLMLEAFRERFPCEAL